MGKKILVGFVIFILVIILFIIGFFIYLKLNSRDINKIDDSALYPSSQILSKEDNAFYNFKQASDSLVLPKDKIQEFADLANGINWNETLANQVVDDNSIAITFFNQGLLKKGYQDPALQVDIKSFNANTTLTGLAGVRDLVRVSAIKSWILLKQGKDKEAFDNTLGIIYAGQLIENSPRVNFVGFLVGMSIKEMGIKNIQSMIVNSNLHLNDLKKLYNNN